MLNPPLRQIIMFGVSHFISERIKRLLHFLILKCLYYEYDVILNYSLYFLQVALGRE